MEDAWPGLAHPVGAARNGIGQEVARAAAGRELAHGVAKGLARVLKLPLGRAQLESLVCRRGQHLSYVGIPLAAPKTCQCLQQEAPCAMASL